MYSGEHISRSSSIHFQDKKSHENYQPTNFSIRQLTFEALKVIEQANKHVQDVTLNQAQSSLNELITKSLATNTTKLSSITEGKTRFQSSIKHDVPGQEINLIGINKDRYKTELCRKFMENSSCPYSKRCQFAHGYHELRTVTRHPRYRTELCREFFNHGLCTYGTRCNFIHELKKENDEYDSHKSLDSQGTSERPYTPSNDSGLSISAYSPIDSNSGSISPIESTRISDRSDSPSDLVAIQETEE